MQTNHSRVKSPLRFLSSLRRVGNTVAVFVVLLVQVALPVGLNLTPALTPVAQAATGINSQINFQARLLNSAGATVADGNYNIEFKIYQDGTGCVSSGSSPCGGTLKWTEDWLNNASNPVVVKNGYFSVYLGSITAFGTSIDWNQDTLWLSINVGSTAPTCTPFSSCTPDGEMIPFKRFAANPYALNSAKLQGIDATGFVQLGQGTTQSVTTATSAISVNQTSTGNLLDLQSSGTAVFDISSTGDQIFGQNADHTISVTTTATNAAGKALTVSAGAGGTGAGANAGGALTVVGGAGGGTNGNGGNVVLQGGAKNGTGTSGSVIVKPQAGNDSATAFQVQQAGGTAVLAVDTSNARVGIGTTAPQAQLDVVGDIISKGTKWTTQSMPANNNWNSVAYGNGLFVAVAWSGAGNRVMTSPDGINWTTRTSAADNQWINVTYGAGLFVAVASSGSGNRVMTSPDGINWTTRTSAANYSWTGVTYGNGTFVAVAADAVANNVMTSPDGISWTLQTAATTSKPWQTVAYGDGKFVAVASSGTTDYVMTSPDGVTWTTANSAQSSNWITVVYGNGLFVAVANSGTNRVMTSPDGVTWSVQTAPANGWQGLTFGNGVFVAVANGGTSAVMTSLDGVNWVTRTNPTSNSWRAVTYGNGTFVAVATGATGNGVMTSGKLDTIPFSANNVRQGGETVFGSSTFRSAPNSSTSFRVQNSSGTNVLSVDTTTPGVSVTGTLGVSGTTTLSGNANLNGNTTIGDATTDRLTVTSQLGGATPFVFQGATDNAITTSFVITDPTTTSKTITFGDETGTVCTTAGSAACTAVYSVAGAYLQQVPSSTAVNTVTPTVASVVGLTVNGTSNATSATAVVVNQSQASDGVNINLTNTAGTQTNGLAITRNGAGGTTSNLLALTNTAGTATNGLSFSGTFTKLINSTNFNVSNAGAVTAVGIDAGSGLLQGTGGITAVGAVSINASGANTTSIGTGTNTGTIGIGNASAGAITLQSGGAVNITAGAASTISTGTNTLAVTSSNYNLSTAGVITLAGGQTADITTAAAGAANAITIQPGNSTTNSGTGAALGLTAGNNSGTTSTGGSVTVDAGTGTTTNGSVNLGTTNANAVSVGRTGKTTTVNGALTVSQGLTANGAASFTSTINQQLTSATAATFQSAAAADTILTIDTSSANKVKIGNDTGTGASTTVLVLDSATTSTGLAATAGSMYYDTTAGRIQCYESGAWGNCGNTTLQEAYASSTGSTTPEILADATRGALDVQDANTTLGANVGLLSVRGAATATTLGASLFVVNAGGKVGIANGGTTNTNTLSYDLSFGQGAARTIGVEVQGTTATAGNSLTITSGTGNTSGVGGALALQGGTGGNAAAGGAATLTGGTAGGGNSAGGAATVTGGTATGTGTGGTATLAGGSAAATAGSAGGAVAVTAANGSSTGAGGNGGSVTITAGNGLGTGPSNGGSITLQAGSGLGGGTAGTLVIQGAGNSTSAVTINSASAGDTLFTVNTTNNRVKIGNDTGTNANTTVLVLDSATSAPATAINGGLFYNSTLGYVQCYQAGAWGNCGAAGTGTTLQGAYTSGTGGTTPEIVLDSTRNGIDIQDANTTSLGSTVSLLSVRASATASTLGASYLNVNASGKVGINIQSTSDTPTISYDLSFGETGNKTIGVEARASNAAGRSLTVSAGAAGSGASAFAGGVLTLQGGAAGGTGNANGGGVTLAGGAGTGTGTQGLVNISTTAFTSAAVQTFSSSGVTAITAGNVDLYSTLPVTASTTGVIVSVPDPAQSVIGRVLYLSARSGSSDFTLRINATRTLIDIAMKANSTATLIWNGTDWTAAGASSSTDLQSAYNNTLTSAGGAELVLNAPGGNADGLTIRNNGTTPIVGAVLEVQTSIGSSLLSINNNAVEYATNGGAETQGTTSTTFPAASPTWKTAPNGGTTATITRDITTAEVATGQGSVKVVTGGTTANQGADNELAAALTANLQYSVSFAIKGSTNFSLLDVVYSKDGTNTGTTTCATAQTVTQGAWSRIICTFTAPASGITSSNAIFIRESDTTVRTFYIDNLSVTVAAGVNHAADGSVSSALGTNWAAIGGSVARSTTVLYDTSGSVQATTSAVATRGVYNNLTNGIIPQSTGTQYRVSFYARGDGTNTLTIAVAYAPNNGSGTGASACTDYNTQTVAASAYTLISCLFSTVGTAISGTSQLQITQTAGSATSFYVDALSVTLNTNTASNVQIGGANLGGPSTLLTLDRASSAPIAANNDAYLGSMYYDTTTGRIQCYESDGWGACGAAPDNIVNLTPEYPGAVLNGTGIGTMTADFCANQTGVLTVNTALCDGTGSPAVVGGNFYKWTSPQATQQTYSIYVTYQLPSTFKSFASDNTVQLTARVDSTTNAAVTYEMFRSEGGVVYRCYDGVTNETAVTSSANVWQTVGINGNEATGCSFTTSSAGSPVIFKINLKANSNANAYVSGLSFTTNGR